MNEIIKITEKDGKRAVSARELHQFLESKQDFSTWIKSRIEKYDFVENQDYQTAPQIYGTANGGHSTRTEYALTINMAKRINAILRHFFFADNTFIVPNKKKPQIEKKRHFLRPDRFSCITDKEKIWKPTYIFPKVKKIFADFNIFLFFIVRV